MDLVCVERLSEGPIANNDSVIFKDMRVLKNLLQIQRVYMPPCNYFGTVQNEIHPITRKVATAWMLEFCEEQMCEDQVFPLAVNFLDRFLCLSTIRREQLQLLACACLLLASKIRQCHVLSVNTLCAYAEHGFSAELLRKWERLLLLKLEWCATAVTGFDFVDHVLQRTPWGENNPVIQRHAHTLVALCYTEPDFIQTLPSLLTAGSIIAAVRGLRIANQKEAFRDVCTLTRSDPSDADAMASRIEVILATATVQQQDSPQLQSANKAATSPGSASSGNKHVADMDDDMNHTPETPTDIHDIHF